MRLPRLLIVFSIFFSTHYYIWARLVRDTELDPPWFFVATLAIVLLCVGVPTAMLTTRRTRKPTARALMAANYMWMGLFFMTLCLLAAVDAAHGVWWLCQRFGLVSDASPTSLAIRRLMGTGVVVVALCEALFALRSALTGPKVKHVTVRLRRWPKALDGLKVVQISDLHVAPLLGREYVQRVVERTNALTPDVIAITGDMVDGTVPQLRDSAAPLAGLRAKLGTFFVTGNHEFYWDADAWVEEVRRLGMRPLRGERCTLGVAPDTFDVAGVDDITAGHADDIERTMHGRDPTRAVILLAHQPKVVDEAAKQGADLMLCGHTHGGQIWPFGYLVRLAQPYLVGLATHGPTQIYVNRGTGYWGPPMRLGGSPELTLLRLYAQV